MKHILKAAASVTLILVSLLGPAAAETTGAAFLNITPSVRSYSLGMTNNVSAVGAEAIGANPANLGLMPRKFEAFTSFATLMGQTQYEHLAAAFSPEAWPVDALGLSVTRLQSTGFEGADAAGNKTGSTFDAGSTAASLSASALLSTNLRTGLTVKFIDSQYAGTHSKAGFAGDIGITYTLSEFQRPVSIGLSLNNAGPGIKTIDQTDKLPTSLNAGVALPFGALTALFEINQLINQIRTELGCGLEYGMGPVALRLGYLAQNNSDNLALKDQGGVAGILGGLSGGVGVRLGVAKLDYAISQQAVEFGMTQRVSLSVQWGGHASKARATASLGTGSDKSDWLIQSMGSY